MVGDPTRGRKTAYPAGQQPKRNRYEPNKIRVSSRNRRWASNRTRRSYPERFLIAPPSGWPPWRSASDGAGARITRLARQIAAGSGDRVVASRTVPVECACSDTETPRKSPLDFRGLSVLGRRNYGDLPEIGGPRGRLPSRHSIHCSLDDVSTPSEREVRHAPDSESCPT